MSEGGRRRVGGEGGEGIKIYMMGREKWRTRRHTQTDTHRQTRRHTQTDTHRQMHTDRHA